ncbi:MAG: hypothetical protein WAM22_07760, partial [Nitrososphaeraceae archaeon]
KKDHNPILFLCHFVIWRVDIQTFSIPLFMIQLRSGQLVLSDTLLETLPNALTSEDPLQN